jgi:hypothetical protein
VRARQRRFPDRAPFCIPHLNDLEPWTVPLRSTRALRAL